MVNFLSFNGSTCSYWDNWCIDFFINTILGSQVIKLRRGDISGCTCRPAHKYMSSCGSANVRTSVCFLLSCSQPRLCYLSLLCTASICSQFACRRGRSLKCIWWQVPVVCLRAVYKYTPDNKVTVDLPACLHEISKRVNEKHGHTGTGETWWHSPGHCTWCSSKPIPYCILLRISMRSQAKQNGRGRNTCRVDTKAVELNIGQLGPALADWLGLPGPYRTQAREQQWC